MRSIDAQGSTRLAASALETDPSSGSPPITESLAGLVAARLRVLGQPTRLRLLKLIELHPDVTARRLADLLETSQQNVSQHLGILFREGVVSRQRRGSHVRYFVDDPRLLALIDEIAASISRHVLDLARIVDSTANRESGPCDPATLDR